MEDALKKSILLNPLCHTLLGLIKEGHTLANFDKDLGKQRSNATKFVEKAIELGPENMEALFFQKNFTE